jgi:AraC family transcriptional regulator, regulatory protein of adaptative response / methylphosphotriester-DNA alkyltransferase methyltransferase
VLCVLAGLSFGRLVRVELLLAVGRLTDPAYVVLVCVQVVSLLVFAHGGFVPDPRPENPAEGCYAEQSTTDRAICMETRPREMLMEDLYDTSARRRALFTEALAVIERRYDDDRLTVDRLSRDVFASRRQVQRCFAEAGTSVQERLHAVRMQRAAELLQTSSLPVGEVTRMVGYRAQAQFAKAFRRYHGMPPSRWRATARSSPTVKEVNSDGCQCGCANSPSAKSVE